MSVARSRLAGLGAARPIAARASGVGRRARRRGCRRGTGSGFRNVLSSGGFFCLLLYFTSLFAVLLRSSSEKEGGVEGSKRGGRTL